MRILFVAMSDSIHTARWISLLHGQNWDLHLFPSLDVGRIHPDLMGVTVHHSFFGPRGTAKGTVRTRGVYLPGQQLSRIPRALLRKFMPDYRQQQLRRLIGRLKPDVVHSMELQSAGYLTLGAKHALEGRFPTWIVTNWGSDIYLFGRLPVHRERLKQVLAECDFYSCECRRDVDLARRLELKGEVLPVLPNSGGFDIGASAALREVELPSSRKLIMLKGYQGWAGRALVGLRALKRCADLLQGYTVVIYSATDDVRLAAELFEADTGISTCVLPQGTPHRDVLAHHARARVSIGLSISDAISTSFLEAMVMGSLPIQSTTGCADEWAEDGKGALFVPAEDPEAVEAALRRALSDDDLVNAAAASNWETARRRLDIRLIQPQVVDLYRRVASRERPRTDASPCRGGS